jgi:hypothetical protein
MLSSSGSAANMSIRSEGLLALIVQDKQNCGRTSITRTSAGSLSRTVRVAKQDEFSQVGGT